MDMLAGALVSLKNSAGLTSLVAAKERAFSQSYLLQAIIARPRFVHRRPSSQPRLVLVRWD
jgi:hypothetical protein